MTKKALSFLAVIVLIAGLLPSAFAAVEYMQSIDAYFGGAVVYEYELDKNTYHQEVYEADGDAQYYATEYANYLVANENFSFLGTYSSSKWVHIALDASGNYNTFKLKSNGKSITPACVVLVSYKPGSDAIYVRHSEDFIPADLGARMSGDATSSASSNTPSENTRPNQNNNSGRCSRCNGRGRISSSCIPCGGDGKDKCMTCGGDGRRMCMACSGRGYLRSGGDCSCSGGYKSCSSCSGSGRRSCYQCGGDGRVERDCPDC